MKSRSTLILAAIISAVALATLISQNARKTEAETFSPEITLAFSKWGESYKRLYSSPEERTHRMMIFADSFDRVRRWRLNYLRDYDLELNKFADLSDEEFGAKFGTSSIEERVNAKYKNDGSYGGPNCKSLNCPLNLI